jgi:hypothetical protein
MKNLVKAVIPFAIAGFLTVGCTTMPRGSIKLENGYYVQSYSAMDELDLAASARVGEKTIQKTKNGNYTEGRLTGKRVSDDYWEEELDFVCKKADVKKSKFITDGEALEVLKSAYEDTTFIRDFQDYGFMKA